PAGRSEPLVSTQDSGVLAGPKGAGKTFELASMSVAVALGVPWLDRFNTEQARVLLLTAEDSEARMWKRIDAIAASYHRDPADLEGWLFVHPKAVSLVNDLDRLPAPIAPNPPRL